MSDRIRSGQPTLRALCSAGLLAALTFGIGTGAAHASASLSPVTYRYAYDGHAVDPTSPGTYSFTDGDASGQVTFGLTPTPSILATASDTGAHVFSGLMTYFYHITGLAPGGTVRGTITTHQSDFGTPTVPSGFWENSTTLTAGSVSLIACSGSGGDTCYFGHYPNTLDVTANSDFSADGSISLSFNLHMEQASGRAFIDPVITLPTGYTITFSPGVGNSDGVADPGPTATPEPATFALLGTGLVGLLAARRRR